MAFPDVCKTPAGSTVVPVPYPNMGQLSGTDQACAKVLVENKETVVESSKIPCSSGDEAGTAMGVVSGTNMGEVAFRTFSSKVYAQGKKIVFHTATTAHNGSNANMPSGCHVAPSQAKVLVAT
ncbi:MAG: DUF4150 domain-containing protein [Deltaproteobacteria bacterium]|nr:DUF4150 domain-containing protein [Deltaproteobacteria bacterium]